jgi:1-acyl-sn-glycerol-3-phosphate acyltransferase
MIRTAIAFICLALITLLLGPPLLLYSLLAGSTDLLFRAGRRAAVQAVRGAGVRTRAEGIENIPAGTCLFVANHTSNIDPPVIVGAIPRRIAILVKKSIFAIPVVGTAFRMAHFVPIDRAQPSDAKVSLDLAAQYMKQGTSFLIYPEGTRSANGRLLPFKKAGFALAIKARVPVVPVACSGAHRILPKGSLWVSPGEIIVRFCPPVDATAFPLERRGDLAARVHAAIAAALPSDQRPDG